MFDAPSQIFARTGRVLPLEEIEDLAVAAVSDRVNTKLVAVIDRGACRSLDGCERARVVSRALRQVVVGLQQPGPVRSERAVDVLLDRANREAVPTVANHTIVTETVIECFHLGVDHDVQSGPETSPVGEGAVQIDRPEAGTRVVEARDAFR